MLLLSQLLVRNCPLANGLLAAVELRGCCCCRRLLERRCGACLPPVLLLPRASRACNQIFEILFEPMQPALAHVTSEDQRL
jgi:hypothetical protein